MRARRRRLRARPRLGLWLGALVVVIGGFALFGRPATAPGRVKSAASSGRAPASRPTTRTAAPPPTRLAAVSQAPALPETLEGLAAAASGGRLWAIGGLVGGNTSTTDVFSWKPGQASWRRVASLPEPRHDGAAAAVGGQVWFVGGGLGTVSDPQATAFVPTASGVRVRALPPLPGARSDLAAVGGSEAYVVGGYNGLVDALDVLALRPGGSWRTVAVLPQGARYAAVARVGQELYVFGGLTPSGLTDAIWAVDLRSGKVHAAGRLPVPTDYMSAVVVRGRIFVLGGENQSGDVSTIWRYDPADGRLLAAGSLPSGRGYGAAAVLGGKVYYLGGDRGGAALDQVVVLAPKA